MSDKEEMIQYFKDHNAERFEFWNNYLGEFVKKTKIMGNSAERACPEKAIACLMMMEAGERDRNIRDQLGWNWETLYRFRTRHAETLKESKDAKSREFANNITIANQVAYMKLEEAKHSKKARDQMSLKDIGMFLGISTDKGLLLNGMATTKVEVEVGATMEDAVAFLKRLKEKSSTKVIEAEVVNSDA